MSKETIQLKRNLKSPIGIFDSIDQTFDEYTNYHNSGSGNYIEGNATGLLRHKNPFLPVQKREDLIWVSHYMDTFYQYAKKCNNHIAELGVNQVCSTWSWAKARPKKITICDIELYERGAHYLDSFLELCEEEGIEVVCENKSSLDIELRDVDMLFVDSQHEYDHVTKELNLHAKHVHKYIAFHDTVLCYPDVGQAVEHFLTNNKKWVIELEDTSKPGIIIIKRIEDE
jgi:hypothetical protein